MRRPRGPGRSGWTFSGLRPLALLLIGLLGLASVPAVTLVGCAAHEIGHGLAGTALGYEVELIRLCPGAAGVDWAPSPLTPIDTTVEAWAGGLFAGVLLLGVYGLLAWTRAPLRSPPAWVVGFPLASIGAGELLFGILEGAAQGRESQLFVAQPLFMYPLVAVVLLGPCAIHLIAWRGVLR